MKKTIYHFSIIIRVLKRTSKRMYSQLPSHLEVNAPNRIRSRHLTKNDYFVGTMAKTEEYRGHLDTLRKIITQTLQNKQWKPTTGASVEYDLQGRQWSMTLLKYLSKAAKVAPALSKILFTEQLISRVVGHFRSSHLAQIWMEECVGLVSQN